MTSENLLAMVRRRSGRLARFWLAFDWLEFVGGIAEAPRFLREQPGAESVLLIELNRFHAEVLPGYCKYFKQIGLHAVVLTRRANARSGAFDHLPDTIKPTVYAMHPVMMRWLLHLRRFRAFEFMLIASSHWAEPNGYWGTFLEYLGFVPSGRVGYATVVHDLEHISPHLDSGRIQIDHCVMLTPGEFRGRTIRMVNPHYFGARRLGARPHKRRRFVTVGALSTANRNFNQLVHAVQELQEQGLTSFEVRVIGRSGATSADHRDAPPCMKFLGNLSYPELYDELAEADFLLALLDPACASHRRYLGGSTTGSRQLWYGFGIVPVIDEEFAKAYGLEDGSAIVYSSHRLAGAMKLAIDLSPDEYRRRWAILEHEANRIADASLQNLRDMTGRQAVTVAAPETIVSSPEN